ncbi:MAG: hypothetical protein VKP63_09935 [Cyanobacteriota bacterium]|nr:hypothetical protein [Cyanobacteriota bacterium]
MPLRIDRVDTEFEFAGPPSSPDQGLRNANRVGLDDLNTMRGRSALRAKLQPIVVEILNDELMRIKRKVGAP